MNKYNAMLAWFAGFFDGEGSISIIENETSKSGYRHWFSLVISVTNTYLPALEKVRDWWDVGAIALKGDGAGNQKLRWRWIVPANKALIVLEETLPYLSVKHKQARLAIAFQKLRRVGRYQSLNRDARLVRDAKFKHAMNILNKRGV